MPRVLRALWAYTPLLLLALTWEAIADGRLVSQYALPSLTAVLSAWWKLLFDPLYYRDVAASFARMVAGLGAAIVTGVVLGTAIAWWRWVNVTVGPVVQLFYPMPKSALIPLTIIWFGVGSLSKMFLIFLGCLLPVTIATFNGVRGVERTLIWSAQSLGAGRWELLADVAVAAAIPDILAGVRTALALAFVLLVSSELLMANDGIGYLIRTYGDGGQYARMFACVITVMLLGFCADRAFSRFSAYLLRWRP